jgi:hypothetical protein
MSREPTAIELLALGGFVVSGGFFAAVLDEGWPRLDRSRWGCLALTGVLLGIALISRGPGWSITLSGLAVLMSLIAVACAIHGEHMNRETEANLAEPAWWPEFERDFADYVRLGAHHERRGGPGCRS